MPNGYEAWLGADLSSATLLAVWPKADQSSLSFSFYIDKIKVMLVPTL